MAGRQPVHDLVRGVWHAVSDSDCNSDGDDHIHADSNSNSNSDCYGNGCGEPDSNRFGDAAVYRDAKAAPDASTAPVNAANSFRHCRVERKTDRISPI